ncbi:hypothetical protein N7539_007588 [Penicillium diatomitis]|uniref:Xylanolytic transcriptional activator regulatory domain-containing protein n=1 Tax=Penicillium diatomitis TaxID=2819901 RepID=A0A9W9WVD1_9EURO|nr:uncharacterized protein N7539_007588 [Penicillium diatomitis]KAJ5477444.1 hypothetical protein N7539_007588 [Penicillium diatomitis]
MRGHIRPSDDVSVLPAQNDSAKESVQPAGFSVSAPQQLHGPEHQASLGSNVASDAGQARVSNIAAPQSEAVPPPGVLPLSFGYLTKASVHHSPEPNVNSHMTEDEQSYYGWNASASSTTDLTFQGNSSPGGRGAAAVLKHWLQSPIEGGISQSTPDTLHERGPFAASRISGGNANLASNNVNRGHTRIPSERFEKVQRCWLAPPNRTGRLMNRLWYDVVSSETENLLSENSEYLVSGASLSQGSRRGIDEACRDRLRFLFDQVFVGSQTQSHFQTIKSSLAPDSSFPTLNQFPQADFLDLALDLYFRTCHPLLPFVHLPTFSAKSARAPLLWVMCLIGMMVMGSDGAASFVSRNFQFTLEKIMIDLAQCTTGTENPAAAISTFATAILFLNLAVLTEERAHLEQCQILYVNLMSITQRHGLFAAIEGQLLEKSLYDMLPDLDMRWKAWSRIETTKRIIIGLILVESWHSALLSTSPVIVPDSIQIHLPCDESLYIAPTSQEWNQLTQDGKHSMMPAMLAPSDNIKVPSLEGHMHEFCIQTVLAIVQIRQSEAYHRLLSNRASDPLAPCNTYAMDGRARCLSSLQAQIATCYGEAMDRMNPNTIVMWHHMCMMLTADIQVFEFAAGRAGPGPAREALDDIAKWSRTAAARRACLHAAQIYKVMLNRKGSELPNYHSVFSLFLAGLILGLYTFMVPIAEGHSSNATAIELMSDIDWQKVDREGFTSFLDPPGIQPGSPARCLVVDFIRNGGTMYMHGVPIRAGYQPARQIFLDYANILRQSGKWGVKKLSYVLQIMSDVLMDAE